MGAALALDRLDQSAKHFAERSQSSTPLNLGVPCSAARQRDGAIVVSAAAINLSFAVRLHDGTNHGAIMPRRSAPTYRKSAARDELRDRLKAALARRLHPRGPWAIKQLAGAIGASPDTVERVFNGQQEALALLLYELARAFRSAGDIGFLREVYGEVVEPAPTPAALLREALRQIETKF